MGGTLKVRANRWAPARISMNASILAARVPRGPNPDFSHICMVTTINYFIVNRYPLTKFSGTSFVGNRFAVLSSDRSHDFKGTPHSLNVAAVLARMCSFFALFGSEAAMAQGKHAKSEKLADYDGKR